MVKAIIDPEYANKYKLDIIYKQSLMYFMGYTNKSTMIALENIPMLLTMMYSVLTTSLFSKGSFGQLLTANKRLIDTTSFVREFQKEFDIGIK